MQPDMAPSIRSTQAVGTDLRMLASGHPQMFSAGKGQAAAAVPQKRKGRGGAAPNGEEHAVFEAPERVRFARVPQKLA